MLRWLGVSAMIGLALLAACGGSAKVAGNAAGAAGVAEAGSAGAGARAGGGGDAGSEPVEADGCRVARSITVEVNTDFSPDVFRRTDWGFFATYFHTVFEPVWLLVREEGGGQRQLLSPGSPQSQRVWGEFPFGASYDAQSMVVLTAEPGPGYDARLWSWSLDSVSPLGTDVGALYDRGTTSVAQASSFDGKRGLFASAHVAAFGPHAVLLDASGARLGDEITFETQFATCLSAVPTFAAGAFSFVDSDRHELTVVELDASGARHRQATLAVAGNTCPLVQATSTGLVVVLHESAGLQAYALEDEPRALLMHPAPVEDTDTPRWFDRSSDGTVALSFYAREGPEFARIAPDGELTWLDPDLPPGNVIPGRPGELWLDDASPGVGAPKRVIHRIACTGPGFSTP